MTKIERHFIKIAYTVIQIIIYENSLVFFIY